MVFAEAGFDLLLVDNLSNSHEATFDILKKLCPTKIKRYATDLRNEEELERLFEKYATEI
ncbi:MAG: hypothetical protein LBP53_02435 [Candidatus Peribacteria bacterium]|nr:hypothetical protein [Candidatus Peribacteria bacterium]